MNNNNRGNNRRRGRGNNRPQGGGQQLNRVDSRARGNAPQMLEKYRKLAHDAHLNGDRVTEEYYLQFADHYFRVIADTRVRQDEARPRRDDRWQESGDEGDEQGEFGGGEYQPYEQSGQAQGGAPAGQARPERGERQDRPREERAPREDRPRRERDDQRGPRAAEAVAAEPVAERAEPAEGAEDEPRNIYEPPANPFLRENRTTGRGLRPRRESARPRPREDGDQEPVADVPASFDVSVLPPSLGIGRDDAVTDATIATGEVAPAPKRRVRKPKAPAPVADEG